MLNLPKPKPKVVIQYAHEVVGEYKLYSRPVLRKFGLLQLMPGQNQDGYGDKITTDYVLVFDNKPKAFRVYATCWSNAASHWINWQGGRLFLRTHFQNEIIHDEFSK